MERSDFPPASTSIPSCVVCTLIFFTLAVMILCGSLMFAFLRVTRQYEQIQELIDKLPSAEEINESLQMSNRSDKLTVEKYRAKKEEYETRRKYYDGKIKKTIEEMAESEKKVAAKFSETKDTVMKDFSEVGLSFLAISENCSESFNGLSDQYRDFTRLMDDVKEKLIGYQQGHQTLLDEISRYYSLTAKDMIPEGYVYIHASARDEESEVNLTNMWPGTEWDNLDNNSSGYYLEVSNRTDDGKLDSSPSDEEIFKNLKLVWQNADEIDISKRGRKFFNRSEGWGDARMALYYKKEDAVGISPEPQSIQIKIFRKQGQASLWS